MTDSANSKANSPHYLLKELHELLRFDPLMFEFLQDGLLDGLWYWDLENIEHEWMSPKLWLTLGYDPSEKAHLASEWQDIIFKDDLAIAQQNFQRHLADPNQPYDQYVRYRHKQGHTVWIKCRGIAIHDKDGHAIRFLGGHIDVTSLMERQESLMSENFKLQQVARKLDDYEFENAKLHSENNHLKQKAALQARYELDSFLATKRYFRQRANECITTAYRLNTPINIIALAIQNHQLITNNFGSVELTNKKITLSNILHDLIPDLLITKYNENMLLGVMIGADTETIGELKQQVSEAVKAIEWSIVGPMVQSHIVGKIPESSHDEQLLDQLIIEAAQLTS